MSQLPAIRKKFWPERQMTEQRSETQELGEVGGPCKLEGEGRGEVWGQPEGSSQHRW